MSHLQYAQHARFELKCVIDPALVRPLRTFIRSYMEADPHADPRNNGEYAVHSLYLDSPAMDLARSTLLGHKNRYKLRMRFYEVSPDSPVYVEIKRRVADVIVKRRACIRRGAAGRLAGGQWPARADLWPVPNDGTDALGALERFCALRDRIEGRPTAFVSYQREAYVAPENPSTRITFDRRLAAHTYRRGFDDVAIAPGMRAHVGGVVLEIKFTDRFPNWMREMVEVFSLVRQPMAKYVTCVQELGLAAGPTGRVFAPREALR